MNDWNEITRLIDQAGTGRYPGATPEEISELEKKLEIQFPPELREWLLVCGGTRAGFGGIYGTAPDKFINITARCELHPAWTYYNWIPVAGDGFGNSYVITHDPKCGRYPICFVDVGVNEDALTYVVSSSLFHFLQFMLERDLYKKRKWPFDRDYVLKHDPAIAEITIAKIPFS